MITVEELIVQSLYHRLVLITVRRTPSSNEDGTSEDSEHGKTKGQNTGDTLSKAGSSVAYSQDLETASQGLGYLYLGSLGLPNSDLRRNEASTDAGVLERESSPVATINLKECSSTSEALIRSLGTEEITIRSKVCAVLDTKDIRVIQMLLKTAEAQTDFEPTWSFERNLFSSSTSCDDLLALQSQALSSRSGPLIDLRNCDQFSVIRLEDLQDPASQSFVMVDTNEIKQKPVDDALYLGKDEMQLTSVDSESDSQISFTPIQKFYANSERLSGQGALYVEDSKGHLKRESFPSSDVVAHPQGKALEVDSGIWDMMQALESGGGTQILPETETSHSDYLEDSEHSCLDSSSDLRGTYRMFTLSEQSREKSLSPVSKEVSSSFGRDKNMTEFCKAKVLANEGEGGLSDALKPAAALNFVIHRVESEMNHGEAREDRTYADKSLKKDKGIKRKDRTGSLRNLDRMYRRPRSLRARKITKNVCQTCHKCKSRSTEDQAKKHVADGINDGSEGRGQQEVDSEFSRLCQDVHNLAHSSFESAGHQCTCPAPVHLMERGADDDYDDPGPEQEHYQDVIKVTSLKMNHSGFSTGSSHNLLELGRRFHPWEIVVPPRKSQSERSSPLSSRNDLRAFGQQQHTTQTFDRRSSLYVQSANASPTRRSLRLSSPVSRSTSKHSATTAESPNTPLPDNFTGSSRGGQGSGDWGSSSQWSGATTDSLLTINATCDPPEIQQFEKFPDWMQKLRKELHAVPLSELCIPGSHIALAIEKDMKTGWDFSRCNYEMAEFLCKLPNLPVFNNFRDHMKSIWKAWMPKQWLSVHDQLVAGSRYFDLRITKHNDTIFGEHGLYTRQLKKYLKEVRLFMEEQPFEAIILHFQSCEYLDRSDKRHLVTMLFQIFGGKMVCRSDGVLPTLEWMWQRKKQLVIIFPEADMEVIKNHIFGALMWSDTIVEVTTPKKLTVVQLVEYLDDSVKRQLDARDMSKLFVCKAVLSPDMSTVFGKFQYRCMRELVSCEISSALRLWLERQCRLNIVAVDFVGIAGTVEKILELNGRCLVQEK